MFNKFFSKMAKWTIALMLIGFGIALILQNLSIISLEMSNVVWNSWPIIIVLIGLVSFSNYFIPYKSGSWKFGSFLIVYGALLWAGNFNYIEFGLIDVWKLWPLILIYIGTNILAGRKTVSIYVDSTDGEDAHKDQDFIKTQSTSNGSEYNHKVESEDQKEKTKGDFYYHYKRQRHFISDINYSKDNWEVKDMDLWTGIGDLYFDFSKAYIPNHETKIRLRGYIADIHMKLPENVAYKIYANVKIGDAKVFNQNRTGIGSAVTYVSDNYDTATKKIDIHMDYKIGDIRVNYV
ncbi:cell wall-active antibiotics response protein LiaF [Piscibacillus halophilus]|uniref:Lia operon protein LiaF n=1 Tax=Piscibacillus halophilus TaxID=571933 RepID=A0A1H9AYT2_9BACI|nr:cell wall-active antibiotics response protein LiaF [Piscibacillus halophilus]SEP81148.1 lia operon protein LiaF [Piscibacillus halophilus]